MYGQYHERKFDMLGLTLRLENLAKTLYEELISGDMIQGKIFGSFLKRHSFIGSLKYI
jgi:hypothetical protein